MGKTNQFRDGLATVIENTLSGENYTDVADAVIDYTRASILSKSVTLDLHDMTPEKMAEDMENGALGCGMFIEQEKEEEEDEDD